MKKILKNVMIFGTGSVIGFFLPEIVAVISNLIHVEFITTPTSYGGDGGQYSQSGDYGTNMKMGFCAAPKQQANNIDEK